MPRACKFTGRKTQTGFTYTRRGKAKYLGGVGVKVTGRTKRTFKANVRKLTVVVDGSVQRMSVSAKAMKMGLVVKPLKRKYVYKPAPTEAAGAEQAGVPGTPETAAGA